RPLTPTSRYGAEAGEPGTWLRVSGRSWTARRSAVADDRDPGERYGRFAWEKRCEWLAAHAPGTVVPRSWGQLAEEERELWRRTASAVAAKARLDVNLGGLIRRLGEAECECDLLREAVKRHTSSFTDPDGTALCGGCLEPAPCRDTGLLASD